jgi:hypothetical protein
LEATQGMEVQMEHLFIQGFKPAFVIMKNTDSATASWGIMDNKRDSFNVTSKRLFANTSDAEATGNNDFDLLSNGFKCRSTSGFNNTSGQTLHLHGFCFFPFYHIFWSSNDS